MIVGAHTIIYSSSPDEDRAFFRDLLKLPNVDVGEGWLIFGLPPAEVAVHPHDANDLHEFYLMCDDIGEFVSQMNQRRIPVETVQDHGWGLLTRITLPGGGRLGVYQPRHARPSAMPATRAAKKAPRRAVKSVKAATKAKSAKHADKKKSKRR